MEYKISKMIANKKKYIFHIIMAFFVLIAITISIIGAFITYQYKTTKINFSDNQYAKSIEISSFNIEKNNVRKLNRSDIEDIGNILSASSIKHKVIAELQINFGIPTVDGDVFFVKTFTNNIFLKDISCKDCLITKKDYNNNKLMLNIPIITYQEGGYKSDKIVSKSFNLQKLDENSVLNRYFKPDELIVSEETFNNITGIMFPDENYLDVEKIYVNVDLVEDVKPIAKILSDSNYNTNHAFDYYSNLDTSIGKIMSFSMIVLIVLLVFTICILTGIFELMLKNSVGDIAILRHLGFEKKSILKIYLYPMLIRYFLSIVMLLICNIILFKVDIIKSVYGILISEIICIAVCLITLVLMGRRIMYYSEKGVLSLIKHYKVEE